MFHRILVPLDGSPQAETALAPALALAKCFNGEMLLVRTALVHPFPGTHPGPAQMQAIEEAKTYLEAVATRLRKEGVAVMISVPYDSPVAGIIDQAAFRKVDLIVMVASGGKGLAALLHPRIAWKVFAHTNAPLLVWKGSTARGDAMLREDQDSCNFVQEQMPPAFKIRVRSLISYQAGSFRA